MVVRYWLGGSGAVVIKGVYHVRLACDGIVEIRYRADGVNIKGVLTEKINYDSLTITED